ncbi:MAG: hypothetical protein IPP90_22450 [Gemmatimonadaceae bacterium]|nr:hypothetical protein [Gemmatimonadaceae bacterium]
MMQALRTMLGFAALFASTARAHAQAPVATPHRVVPGDTSLRAGDLRVDTLTYALTGYRDGDEIPVGTITDMITREGGATPLLRRVLIVQRGDARLIDSTLSDAQTLAPRQHRSWQPQRHLQLDFSGLRVRGSIGPPDAMGAAIDTTITRSAFDSGNWDLVLRALPLDSGYVATFPVYDLGNGFASVSSASDWRHHHVWRARPRGAVPVGWATGGHGVDWRHYAAIAAGGNAGGADNDFAADVAGGAHAVSAVSTRVNDWAGT